MEAPVTTASPPPNSTFSSSPPTPLRPAVAPSVQLGFTALYIALYGSLFLVVYVQLWLLFVYKHKRWSYQSLFLFLCLLWAGLRTTLFSFYFHNTAQANHLPAAAFWLLYCSPVCLQFFTFSLINLYFTQVFLKISAASDTKLWVARCAYAAMSVIFLCINVTCAALGERGSSGEKGKRTWKLVLVRVIVNDLLFIMEAVLLAATLLLLTRQPRSFSPYLMSKGTTVCRTAALGAVVIFLFFSRACYNLTVLFLSQNYKVESFDYDWYNVSDQVDSCFPMEHFPLRVIKLLDKLFKKQAKKKPPCIFRLTCRVNSATEATWRSVPSSSSGSCSLPASSSSSSESAGPLRRLISALQTHSLFRVSCSQSSHVRFPQTSSLDINNRVLPRPYFFDDPEGSDDEIPAPWDRSPTQNQR
uniref:Uncharacterized protein n=1 Tax=Poecilia mexicana TaxID=48701 RepID=A0A3B3WN55_9TELE